EAIAPPSDGRPVLYAIVAQHATDVRFLGLWPGDCMQSQRTERTEIARILVSEASPTRPRAPHGAAPCGGVYHHLAGLRPDTAIIAAHYEADFSEHYLAEFA